MTLDEKIEILKAYSEGKTVEELVGGVERTKEFVHNNFIKFDDVLWFFTGVTKDDTRVLLNDVMCTNLEAIKTYGEKVYNIEPIYAMGFRQKVTEKDKESKFILEISERDQ